MREHLLAVDPVCDGLLLIYLDVLPLPVQLRPTRIRASASILEYSASSFSATRNSQSKAENRQAADAVAHLTAGHCARERSGLLQRAASSPQRPAWGPCLPAQRRACRGLVQTETTQTRSRRCLPKTHTPSRSSAPQPRQQQARATHQPRKHCVASFLT